MIPVSVRVRRSHCCCTTLLPVASPLRFIPDPAFARSAATSERDPYAPARAWFASRGMTAFAFQEEVIEALEAEATLAGPA